LEQAKSRGDLGGFNDALDSLEITLQNPELEFHQSQHSLKAELESRLVPWEGLVDIKVIIAEKTLEVTGPRIADVGEVIEEAISNSVRHGKSAHLSVTVNLVDGKDINLTVEDDSNIDIPEYQIRYGLGTKLFNLATDGRWDLRHTSSGSIFEATISLTDGKF
jgi:two-component sensor histidine kinase